MPKKPTILIVEDDGLLREMYKDALSAKDFNVVTAENGQEMFQKLDEHDVDLISLDIIMPEMDGFDALRKIKKDKKRMHLPIIICSNLEHDDDKREVFEMGASCYFVKSRGTPDDLIKLINKHLGNYAK